MFRFEDMKLDLKQGIDDLYRHHIVRPVSFKRSTCVDSVKFSGTLHNICLLYSVFFVGIGGLGKEMLSRKLGIPVSEHRFRYWFWKQRVNWAWRPLRPLTAEEETKTVGELRRINNAQVELRLYLETETVLLSKDMHMIFRPPMIGANERLVFFKLYSTMEGKVRYVGHCFVDKSSRPMQLEYWLNKMAHVGDCKVIEQLYMEVGKYPVIRFIALDKGKTFDENKVDLKNGDIICVQFEEAQREEIKAKDWKPNTKRLKRRMRVTICMVKREDSPPPAPRLQPQTPTPPRPQPPSKHSILLWNISFVHHKPTAKKFSYIVETHEWHILPQDQEIMCMSKLDNKRL